VTVTPADERIHAADDPSAAWSDTLAFSAWDEASGLFLLARFSVLPNRPAATAGVLAWIGTKPFASYGHAVEGVPAADWDDFRIAAIGVRECEPLRAWAVTLDDAGSRLALRWDGFTGVVADAGGHGYGQGCRVTGHLDLNGYRIDVDGVGERRHTWGLGAEHGRRESHTLTGFLGAAGREAGVPVTARSLHLVDAVADDGTIVTSGYVHDSGIDHEVSAVERSTERDDAGSPHAFELMAVAGDRRFTVRGSAQGTDIPMQGSDGGLLHLRLMRLETADGFAGFGLYELFDGAAPV
jgi:hypothetical protein